jgi:hypothetical protein
MTDNELLQKLISQVDTIHYMVVVLTGLVIGSTAIMLCEAWRNRPKG